MTYCVAMDQLRPSTHGWRNTHDVKTSASIFAYCLL